MSSADVYKMTEAFCKLVPAIQREKAEVIDQLCTEPLAAELKTACARLRADGFRAHMVNPWARVLEYKLFGAAEFVGLSPIKDQNFPEEDYDITTEDNLFSPFTVNCRLKVPIPPAEPDPTPKELSNPFSIANLKRNDPSLRAWLERFPLKVTHVDFAILSKLRLRLTDLYSQSKVVAGGEDDDEFEFHLLKFQKVTPVDPAFYERDSDFQRFVDTNFSNDFFKWTVADFDNCLMWSLFGNE